MEKSLLNVHSGFGCEIPPDKSQVVVYFLEKGDTEKSASEFFKEYSEKNWKNKRGTTIKNWKVHAWAWIWDKR